MEPLPPVTRKLFLDLLSRICNVLKNPCLDEFL